MDSESSENIFFFDQEDLLTNSMPILQDLRKSGLFCDVVIKAANQEFPAHRNILAATIPYFYTMFTSEYVESKQREINMKNVDPSILEALIDFSYSGKIKIDPKNIQNLMIAADFVQLFKVKHACADHLASTIKADNVFEIQKLADLLNCKQLASAADKFMKEKFLEIADSNNFLMISLDELKKIIGREGITCTEDKIFEAAMKWVKYKETERISHLPEILSKIELSLVSTEFLVNDVSTEELIMSSFECLRIVDKAKTYHLMQWENKLTQRSRDWLNFNRYVAIKNQEQLQIYDVTKNEWSNEGSLKEDKYYTVLKSLGNKIYVFKSRSEESVDIYDLETKTWSKGEDMPKRENMFHSYFDLQSRIGVTTLNDCIYVCGGSNETNNLSSVDCYSIIENNWKTVAPMLTERCELGVTSLNGYIYVIGGCNYEHDALSSCEKYDPKSNTWTYINSLSCKRHGAGVATINDKIYVCGGYDNGSLNSCEVYDPVKDTWSFIASMNEKRFKLSMTSYNGKLYAVGGDADYSIFSVEVYTPEKISWEMLSV